MAESNGKINRMPLNSVLNPYLQPKEDINLHKDLIEELIQIHGVEVVYLPKTRVNTADLLGEDTLEKFEDYISIEALILNVDGNEGEGDVISQFGIDVRDRCTLQIAKHRWEQERRPAIYTQTGMALVTNQTANNHTNPLLMNFPSSNTALNYVLPERPMEGDLIWFPIMKKLFVISFVEHEKMFYPLGEQMTYQFACELWDYSSERLDTGFTPVDQIEDTLSTDIIDSANSLTTESGEPLLTEDGQVLLKSEMRIEDVIKYSNNELIQNEADEVIILDEKHPFLINQRNY